ncbi:MAG TPA: hypothetical protein VGN69_06335 [Solirubrobacteraceae bacterium]|jgi:drug/metabolite transporter (DMT)-like permease|nr:hypothetical protein [Solirubrobacteraceae bacterium]
MAQTKRKRRTKHRGNAAGVVEARGRTGRKPTPGEKRSTAPTSKAEQAKVRRQERLDRPPTWRAAINRALIAAAFMFALSLLLLKMTVSQAFSVMPLVAVFYVPLGYYTELFMYRRRMRQKASGGA